MSYLQNGKQGKFEKGLAELREAKEKLEDECDVMRVTIEKRTEELTALENHCTENDKASSDLDIKRNELRALRDQERNLEERIEKIRADIGEILYATEMEEKRNKQIQTEINDLKESGDRHTQDLRIMEEQAAANQREIDELEVRIRETNRRYRCPCEIM